MANSWLRLWHDMPNDPKWRTIARVPERAISHHIAPTKKILYQSEALELIRMDAQAVMLSAFLMQKGPLRPAEMETLKLAMDNINKALEISK